MACYEIFCVVSISSGVASTIGTLRDVDSDGVNCCVSVCMVFVGGSIDGSSGGLVGSIVRTTLRGLARVFLCLISVSFTLIL